MSMALTQIGPVRHCTPIRSESSKTGSLVVNVEFHAHYLEERGVGIEYALASLIVRYFQPFNPTYDITDHPKNYSN